MASGLSKNILVTGRPGVGKTTLVEGAVKALGVPVGGFFTREIRVGGRREGFELTTWAGERGVLAHVRISGPFRVGRYGVDIRALEKIGVPAVLEALNDGRLVAIDEIARMELFSQAFQEAVQAALDGPSPVLAVIQERREPFLDGIRRRPDVELFHVTAENRDSLVPVLMKRLSDLCK